MADRKKEPRVSSEQLEVLPWEMHGVGFRV